MSLNVNKDKGWWADHPYERHSVEKDLKRWAGWGDILDTRLRLIGEYGDLYRAIFDFTFETGGRINEVLALKKSNFLKRNNVTGQYTNDINIVEENGEKFLVVEMMPLEKHYKKAGRAYKEIMVGEPPDTNRGHLFIATDKPNIFERKRIPTKKVEATRSFYIPMADVLTPNLVDYLQTIKNPDDLLFTRCYNAVYQHFKQAHIFPHLLRGERAAQLRVERKFDVQNLKDWFGWISDATALHYAKMSTDEANIAAFSRAKNIELPEDVKEKARM